MGVGRIAKGSRFILLPSAVDVTEIPALNTFPDLLRDYVRSKVQQVNSKLAIAWNELRVAHPDLKLFGSEA
jgi:hypothetical protein